MDLIAKDMVQAGIPQFTTKLFKRNIARRESSDYLYLYCKYCSANIACQIMHEDGKVLVTRIKDNHIHTTAKVE